jgi:hypothetical protein
MPDVAPAFDATLPAGALMQPLLHVEYKPETAEEGWRRIMAFFDQHLA